MLICIFDAPYPWKMKYLLVYSISILIICNGCEKEHKGIMINPEDSLFFNGVFATAAYYGPVTLLIDNGTYEFNTTLQNGRGAGKLTVNDNVIEFKDTLSLPILHVYGYAFVPRGNYYYRFNGNKLEIQRYMFGGKIMYELYLMK
jgi:hypothetical protein